MKKIPTISTDIRQEPTESFHIIPATFRCLLSIPNKAFFRMTSSRRILSILFAIMIMPLLADSNGRNYLDQEGGAVFVRVPSTRSKERIPRTGPLGLGDGMNSKTLNQTRTNLCCGTFGHACFGGYGKRGQLAGVDVRDQINRQTTLDTADYKTLQIFRQFCALPPENYLRMMPIFRRLVETYNTAADGESNKRK